MLPVPMTVTAPRVSWLEELMVVSQPPDCLGLYGQKCLLKVGGKGESGAVQRLECLDNVWPSCVPSGLNIDKEV